MCTFPDLNANATWRCSANNFAKFTEKHKCRSLLFNKIAGLIYGTFFKKWLWHRCFRVSFAKNLRTPFFKEHLYSATFALSASLMQVLETAIHRWSLGCLFWKTSQNSQKNIWNGNLLIAVFSIPMKIYISNFQMLQRSDLKVPPQHNCCLNLSRGFIINVQGSLAAYSLCL